MQLTQLLVAAAAARAFRAAAHRSLHAAILAANASAGASNATAAEPTTPPNVSAPTVPPTLPPPSEADVATVDAPSDADVPKYDRIEDPGILAGMKNKFVLQFVRDQVNEPGQARDPLDPEDDHCLTVGQPDGLGGWGLNFSHCHHQDINAGAVPPAQLWYLLPNGQIAWAVNASSDPMCLRRTDCYGSQVYDVASCKRLDATEFAISGTVKGRIDSMKKWGTPLNGVTGPESIHGPYQLYPRCDGVQDEAGCVDLVPKGGWTKLPTQYIGDHDFVKTDSTSTLWDTILQKAAGGQMEKLFDFGGDTVSPIGSAVLTTTEHEAIPLGLAMTHTGEECGTGVGMNFRPQSWWYFVRSDVGEQR
jgi:hypothetical protein